jgi:hypothetical protein
MSDNQTRKNILTNLGISYDTILESEENTNSIDLETKEPANIIFTATLTGVFSPICNLSFLHNIVQLG